MSWKDTMRWRQRARIARWVGYSIFVIAFFVGVVNARDESTNEAFSIFATFAIGGGLAIAITEVLAWLFDKHADRVIKR
jgi:4-hydroxybenzoate polyprenyltransferase